MTTFTYNGEAYTRRPVTTCDGCAFDSDTMEDACVKAPTCGEDNRPQIWVLDDVGLFEQVNAEALSLYAAESGADRELDFDWYKFVQKEFEKPSVQSLYIYPITRGQGDAATKNV